MRTAVCLFTGCAEVGEVRCNVQKPSSSFRYPVGSSIPMRWGEVEPRLHVTDLAQKYNVCKYLAPYHPFRFRIKTYHGSRYNASRLSFNDLLT